MIYSDVTITVKGNTATLDNDLYLYKNDKNITINISIVNSIWNFAKKLENNIIEKTEATFFTLRWMKGDKVKKVFEDQQIKKGKCEFVITEELIDEDIEMGDYDFQISLLDEEKNSILSIPPVIEQIHINKHIFEDEDINTVGNAKVGIAKVGTYEQRSTENSEGLYNKKTWQDNEVITKEDLNTIEEGIYNNSTQCKDIANNKIDDITLSDNVLTILANSNSIKTITLPTSTTGTGTNGREIELQKSTDYIQWRYVGDTDWNNLVALSDLKGSNGRGIVSIENTSGIDLDMEYTITYTDRTTSTFYVTNGAKGEKGDTGATPNLQIGTVETLASGSSATASITGTTENPLLNLGIPRGNDGTGGSSGGSSETLVTDYTYNSNQEIYPTALDLETGVFTCANHGLSTNDIILVVLDHQVTNIPFELYSSTINYFNMFKADVVDSNTFKVKIKDADLVYTNSNNTNVDVTKFHFEKVTSSNLIKVDNLNLKNVKIEVFGKLCGAYPVIIGLFDNTGISLLDNKSKTNVDTNCAKENNPFATLVYEELILKNNILKLNLYSIVFKKDESAYNYLITYPNFYTNQSTITNKSLIFELKEYDNINHITLMSTVINKISELTSYNYFANGTKFKIYDLGGN